MVQRLRQILEPERTEADHQAELIEDEDTTWFGFGRDSTGNPKFEDHGRFAVIMSECHANSDADRYPQLVSFIGETGTHIPAHIRALYPFINKLLPPLISLLISPKGIPP